MKAWLLQRLRIFVQTTIMDPSGWLPPLTSRVEDLLVNTLQGNPCTMMCAESLWFLLQCGSSNGLAHGVSSWIFEHRHSWVAVTRNRMAMRRIRIAIRERSREHDPEHDPAPHPATMRGVGSHVGDVEPVVLRTLHDRWFSVVTCPCNMDHHSRMLGRSPERHTGPLRPRTGDGLDVPVPTRVVHQHHRPPGCPPLWSSATESKQYTLWASVMMSSSTLLHEWASGLVDMEGLGAISEIIEHVTLPETLHTSAHVLRAIVCVLLHVTQHHPERFREYENVADLQAFVKHLLCLFRKEYHCVLDLWSVLLNMHLGHLSEVPVHVSGGFPCPVTMEHASVGFWSKPPFGRRAVARAPSSIRNPGTMKRMNNTPSTCWSCLANGSKHGGHRSRRSGNGSWLDEYHHDPVRIRT